MDNAPKINLTSQIEKRIQDKKIKMRSKWFFVAEKIGLESGLLLLILLGIVILSLTFYIMEENGIFEFLEFGWSGWQIILANIPFDLLIIGAVLFLLSNYMIKQFDVSYKHPFYLFSCGVLAIIGILALVVFWTGVGQEVYNKLPDKFSSIYQDKINHTPNEEKALIGRIIQAKKENMLVETPTRKIIKINIHSQSKMNQEQLSQGQIIKIIGQKQGEEFRANLVRLIKKNHQRYFRTQPAATDSN